MLPSPKISSKKQAKSKSTANSPSILKYFQAKTKISSQANNQAKSEPVIVKNGRVLANLTVKSRIAHEINSEQCSDGQSTVEAKDGVGEPQGAGVVMVGKYNKGVDNYR